MNTSAPKWRGHLVVCLAITFGSHFSLAATQTLSASPNPSVAGSPITLQVIPACTPHTCNVAFYYGTSPTPAPSNFIATAVGIPAKITWTPPSSGTYYLYAVANTNPNQPQYGPPAGTNIVTQVVNASTITGFVNPKYVIVGVTYAPPGPKSSVTYTNSTLVGNTTTLTDSFSSATKLTVKVSGKISAWSIVGGAGVALTGTESTEYTQLSGSSNTTTISEETSVADMTTGTGNAFFPVNHDYDTIWLWLNPLLIYTLDPNQPTNLQWNGYGYDKNDVAGPDVYPVQVGWLNGHFGRNPSINKVLARSWVTATEPGMVWRAGDGPGITSADIATILKADPFTSGTYTLPTPLPSTSADGRFTQISYPPNPVAYSQAGLGDGGGTTRTYDAVYTNTSIVGKNSEHDFEQTFGVEAEFSGGTWFAKFKLDLNQENTLTWKHTWENTLTTTKTLTKALSITGPGCPQTSPPCVPVYTGPGQFITYQDNLYGTFMFYPGN